MNVNPADTLASAGLSFSVPRKNRSPLLVGGGIAAMCIVVIAIYLAFHHDASLPTQTPVPLLATNSTSSSPAPAAAPTAQTNLTLTFEATETRRLQQIAFGRDAQLSGHAIVVTGTIAAVHPTSAGKNLHFDFVGVDNDIGFFITATPELTKKIQVQFAASTGATLVGQKIRVTGVLTDHKGRPEMRIDSMSQIEQPK